jgi:hypothetical protein
LQGLTFRFPRSIRSAWFESRLESDFWKAFFAFIFWADTWKKAKSKSENRDKKENKFLLIFEFGMV